MARAAADALGQEDAQRLLAPSNDRPAGDRAGGTGGGSSNDERETLAPELERVTWLGLQKLEQILRIPTDRGDGNLLRAQTAAAGLAVNAQLRADETRMKQVRRRDGMARIIAMISEEKAKLAEEERLERGETEGSVNSGRQ
jgi:hypothetical protein